MGDKTLTSLPLDVLRSIWHYLILPDVIRFGMATKNMLNLTWPYYQEIPMTRDWPINALSFILSRDLSHIHSLNLYYTFKGEQDRNTISILIQQLESLKLSKLSSLHKLVLDLDSLRGRLHCVTDFISKNDQLQSLSWYTAKVEKKFNVGQFFADHTRLTKLDIQSQETLTGWNLLTQLKSLDISSHYNVNDDLVSEVMTSLTQLRKFNISFNDYITDQSFTKISNLTNLEKFKLKHNDSINSTSLKLLYQLPKLRELALYYWSSNEEICTAAADIIGQLTQLTSLRIDNYQGRYFDSNFLTGLTNLMHLDINTNMDAADLSNLKKLKNLTIQTLTSVTKSTLPPNLEALIISAKKLTEENIEMICSLSELKSLQMNASDFDATAMAHWITQLTSLTELVVIPSPPKELIPALQQLPNLACLRLTRLSNDIEVIEELAKLTQLMELVYWSGYQKDLKTKLPFSVYYFGDLEDT